MNSSDKILVAIQCFTYNHERYIEECLNGFVIQKTNFNFVAIVHDDASTDNTANIVRKYEKKYPNIIHGIYETENQYSKGNGILNRIMDDTCMATGAKYVAICEGDDYWIDPYKLQKQVDFLDAHQEYGMCMTHCLRKYEKYQTFDSEVIGKSYVYNFESILLDEPSVTLTSLFRMDLYRKYMLDINPYSKKWLMGDTPLWLWFSANSLIYNMEDVTAVYRVLEHSASHSNNIRRIISFNNSAKNIRLFFCDRYPDLGGFLEKKVIEKYYRSNMVAAVNTGHTILCLYYFLRLSNKEEIDYYTLKCYFRKRISVYKNIIKKIIH